MQFLLLPTPDGYSRRVMEKFGRVNIAIVFLHILLFVQAGLFCSGCSNDSNSPTQPNPQTGSLSVIIGGLPAGTDGDVDITGPNSFNRSLTTSAVINGVPVGSYTVKANPVETLLSNTFDPTPVTQSATVSIADTAVAQIKYTNSLALTVRVYHGPVKFGESQMSHFYNLIENWGQPPIILQETDTVEFPYPDEYILGADCRVIGTDVTAGGVVINSSVTSMFGSGSSNSSLTMTNGGRTITLANASMANAAPAAGYIGNGTNVGLADLGYPDGQNLHDLAFAVENPGGGSFELQFTWSYEGSEIGGDNAGWKQYFTYQVDALACAPNPPFEYLFDGKDFLGPQSDSGTFVIPLSGSYHLISFGLHGEATGGWIEDIHGQGGAGSAQSSASVTIEIVQ